MSARPLDVEVEGGGLIVLVVGLFAGAPVWFGLGVLFCRFVMGAP